MNNSETKTVRIATSFLTRMFTQGTKIPEMLVLKGIPEGAELQSISLHPPYWIEMEYTSDQWPEHLADKHDFNIILNAEVER